jgi:hypothetical protein
MPAISATTASSTTDCTQAPELAGRRCPRRRSCAQHAVVAASGGDDAVDVAQVRLAVRSRSQAGATAALRLAERATRGPPARAHARRRASKGEPDTARSKVRWMASKSPMTALSVTPLGRQFVEHLSRLLRLLQRLLEVVAVDQGAGPRPR